MYLLIGPEWKNTGNRDTYMILWFPYKVLLTFLLENFATYNKRHSFMMWSKEEVWNRAAAAGGTIRSLILPLAIKFKNLRSQIIIMAFEKEKKKKTFLLFANWRSNRVLAHQQIVNVSLDYGY